MVQPIRDDGGSRDIMTDQTMATKTAAPAFQTAEVESVFSGYPPKQAERLLRLRRLIFETADSTEGVGPLQETLKWGQPSYLTTQTKSGTTIRIDHVATAPGRCAMYVHCQTKLVETFRELYPDALTCEGDRAIVFEPEDDIPESIVRHCIALALTYHLRKSRPRR